MHVLISFFSFWCVEKTKKILKIIAKYQQLEKK
jgi:hypothetical protein